MQTTLLAVGIAIILALVTALVGPFFINWSEYRGLVEAQAGRLAGVSVRISGPIDVRLLPVPSVMLRGVELGPDRSGTAPTLRADKLDVEFALGSLMRGEWRATEVRVAGAEVTVRLGPDGEVAWSDPREGFDADRLTIDRLLVQASRVRLHDAASPEAGRVLEDFWFSGDVRSLIGPLKGEGGFRIGDGRHGFRVSLGRIEEHAARVRLSLDRVERPLGAEADGTLRLERGVPRFEGTLRLAHLAAVGVEQGRAVNKEPWTLVSHIAATPAGILLERLDLQYGTEERALRLGGVAELKLGVRPQLEAVISARQLDIDRLVALPEAARRLPLVAIRAVAASLGDALLPDIPVRLGIGVDALTLAGGNVQMLRGDLVADARGWEIESLEFRAPGFTQVRASGRWTDTADGASFTGPTSIDSADPRTLAAWLEGRSAAVAAKGPPIGPLRASGALTLSPGRIAVERLKAEFDRKEVAGGFAYDWARDGQRPKLDAVVNASELDVDAALRIVRAALPGAGLDFPAELSVALEIGRASVAGIEVSGMKAKLRLGDDGLTFERFAVGDLAGATIDLRGRIEGPWTAPRGSLAFDLAGERLDGVVAILESVSPRLAAILRPVASQLAPAKLQISLDVESDASGQSAEATARSRVDGSVGPLRVAASATLTGNPAAWWSGRLSAEGRIEAKNGADLARLLRLDSTVLVGAGPGLLSWSAAGLMHEDVRLQGRLFAQGLDASASGALRVEPEGLSGKGELSVAASDMTLLRSLVARQQRATPVDLKTSVAVTPKGIAFEPLSGTVGPVTANGRLSLVFGNPPRLEGRIEADTIDAAALTAALIGAPVRAGLLQPSTKASGKSAIWPSQPFAATVVAGLAGQVELSAVRAALSDSLHMRQFRALLRFDENETAVEDVSGVLAGGRVVANLIFARGASGTSADVRLALGGADLATLLPGGARAPARGRANIQVEAKGTGRSAASLVGALGGAGTISLEDLELTGLDPLVFEVATRAADPDVDIDIGRVTRLVNAALERGPLRIARADGALTLAAGQVRLGALLAKGDRADLGVTAHVDLVQWVLDARLTLMGRTGNDAPAAGRPEIFVALRGEPANAERSVDVSSLVGWLTLRAVDLQAKRLEVLEAERRASDVAKAATVGQERSKRPEIPAQGPAASPAGPTPTSAFPPVMVPEVPEKPAIRRSSQASPRHEIATPPATEVSPSSVTVSAPAAGDPGAADQGVSSTTSVPAAKAPEPAIERAPALPPPVNILPAPRPRQAAGQPASPAPPRSAASGNTRLPPPPSAAPARSLRFFDLFGAAR